MFGKKSTVSPLALRKRLLIAESELNRAQLLREWEAMAEGVAGLGAQARFYGAKAATILSLVAGLAALRKVKSAPAAAKSSWFEKIATGARVASALWVLFRARGSDAKKEQR